MADFDVAGIGVGEPFGELFGAIDRAMLAASAAKGDLQGGKVAFEVFFDALCDELFGMGEELVDSGFAGEELDYRTVLACVGLILWVAAGVGKRTAVEYESAAVAGGVGREPVFIAEADDRYGEVDGLRG